MPCFPGNDVINTFMICCHGDVTSQVSTINEVLLIGSYQYDSQIKDFVYRMMKEYNLQVR